MLARTGFSLGIRFPRPFILAFCSANKRVDPSRQTPVKIIDSKSWFEFCFDYLAAESVGQNSFKPIPDLDINFVFLDKNE
jgi:hypothetical protein